MARISFQIRNDGTDELELVAVEQDVYGAKGGLLQRRTAPASSRIAPGGRQTVPDPLPALAPALRGATLVYTLCFRASPVEQAGVDEHAVPPTPRQLGRAWFEALCEVGVYATPGASSLRTRRDRRLVGGRTSPRDDAGLPLAS